MFTLCIVLLITAYHLQDITGASTRRVSSDDQIPDLLYTYGADNVPEKCRDQTYCTIRPSHYPEGQFNKMFDGQILIPPPSLMMMESMMENPSSESGKDDCESSESFKPIYQIRPKRNSEWITVVQAPKRDFIQRVRLVTCDNPSAPCFKSFPPSPDTKVYCKQKHTKWKMLVANGQETVEVEVDLPTCCTCVYKTEPIWSKK